MITKNTLWTNPTVDFWQFHHRICKRISLRNCWFPNSDESTTIYIPQKNGNFERAHVNIINCTHTALNIRCMLR